MKEGIVYCSATTGRLRVMRDGRNVIRVDGQCYESIPWSP